MENEIASTPQRASLSSGVNKYLLLLVLFFGIFIITQIIFLFTQKGQIPGLSGIGKPTNYPTLTPLPEPSAPAAANLEFYRTIRNGQDVTTGKIVTSEYKGKLLALSIAFDSINLKIENEEGFVHELSYGRGTPIDPAGLTIQDIKVDDTITIYETSDVSKTFPANIQKIKIVKYFEKSK